jgi:uncharacterized membrane protein
VYNISGGSLGYIEGGELMEANGTTIINRPVDAVYAYVMDLANDANWRVGLDESGLREGEALEVGGLGYSRVGDKEVEWRIEGLVPGKRVEWQLLNGPIRGRGGYLLKSVEGGTEFTLLAEIKPAGLYKLLGPLFGRMARQRNQADVLKLKRILESMPE